MIFDNQLPVILLAIRIRSEDLKHLIIGTGNPNDRVSIYLNIYFNLVVGEGGAGIDFLKV